MTLKPAYTWDVPRNRLVCSDLTSTRSIRGAAKRIPLNRKPQTLELQREKSTQAIRSKDSQRGKKTQLNALIPKMESLFLGTKNCLVKFGQVLKANRFPRSFIFR